MKYRHLLVILIFLSCQNKDSEKVKKLEARLDSITNARQQLVSIQDAGRQSEMALREEYKGILGSEENKQRKKYCYVIIEASEPERDENFVVTPTRKVYASQILTELDFNEERKYFLLDKFEKSVKDTYFTQKEWEFQGKHHCKVTERTCYVFDTYKEASEHRRKMQE